MKLIIGAGGTVQEGWQATQETELNLLDPDSWVAYLAGKQVQALLAEHVWEHLTLAEGKIAARNCFDHLAPGGYIRVAVPDVNFRNETYQQLVQVGGPGPIDHPAYGHKIVYDVATLSDVFRQAGFKVNLLEYCDANGQFHYHYWHPEDGKIGRSFRYDTRNNHEKLGMVSIILDAQKPLILAYD